MEKAQFERMIEESELHFILAMEYEPRFLVSLHTENLLIMENDRGIKCLINSTRMQCDTLAFGRDEFISMTAPEASAHINACKSRLARAAKTQQGVVIYPQAPRKPAQRKVTPTPVMSTIGYPAH